MENPIFLEWINKNNDDTFVEKKNCLIKLKFRVQESYYTVQHTIELASIYLEKTKESQFMSRWIPTPVIVGFKIFFFHFTFVKIFREDSRWL